MMFETSRLRVFERLIFVRVVVVHVRNCDRKRNSLVANVLPVIMWVGPLLVQQQLVHCVFAGIYHYSDDDADDYHADGRRRKVRRQGRRIVVVVVAHCRRVLQISKTNARVLSAKLLLVGCCRLESFQSYHQVLLL